MFRYFIILLVLLISFSNIETKRVQNCQKHGFEPEDHPDKNECRRKCNNQKCRKLGARSGLVCYRCPDDDAKIAERKLDIEDVEKAVNPLSEQESADMFAVFGASKSARTKWRSGVVLLIITTTLLCVFSCFCCLYCACCIGFFRSILLHLLCPSVRRIVERVTDKFMEVCTCCKPRGGEFKREKKKKEEQETMVTPTTVISEEPSSAATSVVSSAVSSDVGNSNIISST